jgi:hypothetical protein
VGGHDAVLCGEAAQTGDDAEELLADEQLPGVEVPDGEDAVIVAGDQAVVQQVKLGDLILFQVIVPICESPHSIRTVRVPRYRGDVEAIL